jgi:hypothetical protein
VDKFSVPLGAASAERIRVLLNPRAKWIPQLGRCQQLIAQRDGGRGPVIGRRRRVWRAWPCDPATGVWHCWESRRLPMRNELSTIPSSGPCEPTSPDPPDRVVDWLATSSPPHATSRGGHGPANRRPVRVALLGIAPTSHAQRAFHDSQQWAVRADIA